MSNDIYEKNVKAIKKKYPEWDFTEIDDENQSLQIQQEVTYTGNEITSIYIDSKKYYLGGKYNPEYMANLQAKKIREKKLRLQFIIGMSDGRLIREYLTLKEDDEYCLIYEPSEDIFRHMICHYDIHDLFEKDGCIWIIHGFNDGNIQDVMEAVMTIENAMDSNIYIQKNYIELFPKEIEEVIRAIKHGFEITKYNWGTAIYFQEALTENTLLNLRHLCKYQNVGQLLNLLPNEIPAIVVAAGPSLDKNITDLKKAQGKACIIACDTALKPLLKRNIFPDFFVVVDPLKPLELFEDERIWKIPMVCNINMPHKIMDKHIGQKFIFDNYELTWPILNRISRKSNDFSYISQLSTGGSVANSAFSIAKIMGAKNIILVGQDLANTDGKLHAAGTFNGEQTDESSDGIWVESIDGGRVKTTELLQHYLKWFEDQIVIDEKIQVIDATEGGALIHGSKVMKLEEAIQTYCNSCYNIAEILEELPYHLSNIEQEQLVDIYISMPKELENLKHLAEKTKSNYEKLEGKVSNKELKKIVKKISTLNHQLEEHFLWEIIQMANKNEELAILVHTNNESSNGESMVQDDASLGKIYLEKIISNIEKIQPYINQLAEYYEV